MRNHTGIRPWQLSGPTSQSVTWSKGGTGRFLLNDVPELTSGTLCNHLLGILVTAVVKVGDNGIITVADADKWLTWLYESVEVRNAWHGTPVSQNHAKGCMLGLMEFLACGYQYFGRRMCIPAVGSLGGKFVKVNSFIPLSYLMGEKGHHTALPVTFYKNAELQLNFGQGVTDKLGGEGDDTFVSAVVTASAIMLAESEIHLGPGNQFIDYQSPAGLNSEVIKIDSLGMNTSLQDVEAGAGIDFLGWLSSKFNQGSGFAGPCRVKDIVRVGIPFRGVQSTTHLEPFLLGQEAAIGGREHGESELYDATAMQQVASNLAGFPYDTNYQGPLTADFAADGSDIRDMRYFPIIYPGRDLEVTKVQSFEGTQSYFMNFASGQGPQAGGTHHSFAHQFFSWTPAKWDDALRVLVNSGVAQSVIGSSKGLVWSTKFSKKNADPGSVDPAKIRYLAHKLTMGKAA